MLDIFDKLYSNPLIWPIWYSVICGGLIGLEREIKRKSVGIRTSIFICVGAALFSFISHNIDGAIDKSRVIAQIVSGIGFIGAGVIIFTDNKLRGLTSASMVWLTAGIGILNGMNLYLEAVMTTLTMVFVDVVLGKLKWKLRRDHEDDEE